MHDNVFVKTLLVTVIYENIVVEISETVLCT